MSGTADSSVYACKGMELMKAKMRIYRKDRERGLKVKQPLCVWGGGEGRGGKEVEDKKCPKSPQLHARGLSATRVVGWGRDSTVA